MPDTPLAATAQPPAPPPGSAGRAGVQARLGSAASALKTPAIRQILLLGGVAAAVALGMAVVLWSRAPDYGLLYAGLSAKDASNIVQALQSDGVTYKLGSGGGSIFVPASKVDSLRLHLASEGLPQGTASSTKAGSKPSLFDLSDTAQALHDQHLLEQSLARTISGLQPVRSAQVHLAIPNPSEFVQVDSHPSASVVVDLYPGRTLTKQQVSAIVHLVATSVPNLEAARVSVVDQSGDLLTSQGASTSDSANNAHLRMTERVNALYARRVDSILAPIVGRHHVRTEAAVVLNFQNGQQASEVYGKGPQALLSEQTNQKTQTKNGPSGIPGALSNQPPVTVPQPTQANPQAGNQNGQLAQGANGQSTTKKANPVVTAASATRNFDVDHTVTYTQRPAGDIKRLSIAVAVDNQPVVGKHGKVTFAPRSKAEMANLTQLVKGAVGFNAARGDVVSVVNEPFHIPAAPPKPPAVHFWQIPGVMALIRQGAAVVAVLLLGLFMLRPFLRKLLTPTRAQVAALPELEAPPPKVRIEPRSAPAKHAQVGMDDEATAKVRAEYEKGVGIARRAATQDPRQVAQIVKTWMAADGG